MSILRQYFQVIKPGIIFGNLVSVIGGFLLASKGSVNFTLLKFTLSGVSLLMASACIFNNCIDRDIDGKMERTKDRLLVTRQIFLSISIAILLGLSGLMLLQLYVNPITCRLGMIGFLVYIGIYSMYMKRHSVYSTLIGSLSGASPPVIGYCAVTSTFDDGAFILLSIFSFWQIPHSYAIAIFWFEDYQAANIPVLPAIKGMAVTKNHIVFYIIIFTFSTITLFLRGYTGYKYLIVSLIENLWWLNIAIFGYKEKDDKIWARKLFLFSIFIITSLSIMMSVDFRS